MTRVLQKKECRLEVDSSKVLSCEFRWGGLTPLPTSPCWQRITTTEDFQRDKSSGRRVQDGLHILFPSRSSPWHHNKTRLSKVSLAAPKPTQNPKIPKAASKWHKSWDSTFPLQPQSRNNREKLQIPLPSENVEKARRITNVSRICHFV